jgi:glycosyltransferase involved in cell wall biosynthesis
MDALLDNRRLLRSAARRSNMTGGPEFGPMTLSMLRADEGLQTKEVRKLLRWLEREPRPDAIFLGTVLQAGLARPLSRALGVPVYCFLQGEDFFLDALAPKDRDEAYRIIGELAPFVEKFIAPSNYFARHMGQLAGLPPEKVTVMDNAISLEGYRPVEAFARPRTIGFLAHIVPEKGADRLVEAFIALKHRAGFEDVVLKLAGAVRQSDEPFVAALRERIAQAGLEAHFTLSPNLNRAQKLDFLRTLSVFSVPARIGEAFGLYLVEAWASGVPVVQPARGAFPELLEQNGAGVLYDPDTPDALTDALAGVLADPEGARAMGRRGAAAVAERFDIDTMAHRLVEACRSPSAPGVSTN